MELLKRHIITIATGKKIYLEMATNLARSFFYWHKESDISFQLVTDLQQFIPAEIKDKIEVISIKPDEYGEGFLPKISLDHFVSEGQTLFIDSDCLIFGNLDSVFKKFKGHSVSVIGKYISDGEWFGDVAGICKKFNVPHYPKFNGGIYYLEKGILASKVYEKARELEKDYEKIGFVKFRKQSADEVLMALAMQLYDQSPIPDDGTILSDPQCCQGKYAVDIISGATQLNNPPYPNKLHQSWYPFTTVSPLIVHFLGHHSEHFPYKTEVFRIKKAFNNQIGLFTDLSGEILVHVPMLILKFLKDTLRPLYRLTIGTRSVKQSKRI